MRIKDILISMLLLTGPVTVFAAEPEVPQSIIHPEWEYTYYNNFYNDLSYHSYDDHQKCAFTEEKEIDGKNYWLFTILTQTDRLGNTVDRNIPLAYMREENGKVYMLLHPETPHNTDKYGHRDTYGYKDRELMIYDFNLKVGEGYQIGEADTYPSVSNPYTPDCDEYPDFLCWKWRQEHASPYSYLIVWDDGRLSVADIREDERSGRRAWFMHQKCSYPDFITDTQELRSIILDELDIDFFSNHTRTFRFVEGIGCLKSFLPFPGLYPPTLGEPFSGGICTEGTPYLCEITDKTTGETIYKDERRPGIDYRNNNSVNEVGADRESVAPEYYTLQGMRTLNPAPGEICIVRRGEKVTKEVIAR